MSDKILWVFWKIITLLALVYYAVFIYRWFPVMWAYNWVDPVLMTLAIGYMMLLGLADLIGVKIYE